MISHSSVIFSIVCLYLCRFLISGWKRACVGAKCLLYIFFICIYFHLFGHTYPLNVLCVVDLTVREIEYVCRLAKFVSFLSCHSRTLNIHVLVCTGCLVLLCFFRVFTYFFECMFQCSLAKCSFVILFCFRRCVLLFLFSFAFFLIVPRPIRRCNQRCTHNSHHIIICNSNVFGLML